MDVSGLSLGSACSTPPSSPLDWRTIPTTPIAVPREAREEEDAAPRGLSDNQARWQARSDNREIDELMDLFARGFDPSTFGPKLMARVPELAKKAFPGSYEQLFVILLASQRKMDKVQSRLQEWLSEQYPQDTSTPSTPSTATDKADEDYFLTELQILRRLMEPLRGGRNTPLYWMNERRHCSSSICEQLEAAVKVVEGFKRDVLEALEKDTEDRTCYSTLPVCSSRSSMLSMKEIRIDACKAAFKWTGFEKADTELTRFYNFYKRDCLMYRPEKAREQQWLPPTRAHIPRSSSATASQDDPGVWPAHRGPKRLFDLLLKTAIWLAMARGLAAVHLFCDIARLFTTHEPSNVTKEAYIRFLKHLVQIRAHDKVKFHVASPFPYSDDTVVNRNPAFFEGISKANSTLMAELTDRPSLKEKKKDPPPPIEIPPVLTYVRILKTRSGLPGTWPKAATAYVSRVSSVHQESTVAPRRVLPRSLSTTVFQEKTTPLDRHETYLDEPREEKDEDDF